MRTKTIKNSGVFERVQRLSEYMAKWTMAAGWLTYV